MSRRALAILLTVAVAVAGALVFAYFAVRLDGDTGRVFGIDKAAFDVAARLRTSALTSVLKIVTVAGAFPCVFVAVLIGAVILLRRRRLLELVVLAAGFGLVVLATNLAKAGIGRPRPMDPLVHTVGLAYPSGHSSNSTTYIALAVVAVWVAGARGSKAVLIVLAGVIAALVIGATRVYLRAHYLSDVLGGYGLGLAIFAGCAGVAFVVEHIRHNAEAGPGRPQA